MVVTFPVPYLPPPISRLAWGAGPMALSGFLFYQGEANTQNATTAKEYGCLFPELITAWRDAFKHPDLFFGFVQLSTWCALPVDSLPQMRSAQMDAMALRNVGYATNADHGAGCNIHPPEKQWVASRLANAARALVYGEDIQWKSPSYQSATPSIATVPAIAPDAAAAAAAVAGAGSKGGKAVGLAVRLSDVGGGGLVSRYPYNLRGSYNVDQPNISRQIVDCGASFPVNATANASMSLQCAWAALEVEGFGWLNASITLPAEQAHTRVAGASDAAVYLSATLPGRGRLDPRHTSTGAGTARGSSSALAPPLPKVLGSAYGWGSIPLLSLYDKITDLPVLPWNKSL